MNSHQQYHLLSAPVPLNTVWAKHVFILAIVMPGLATVPVVSRFLARRLKRTNIFPDDWFIFAALVRL